MASMTSESESLVASEPDRSGFDPEADWCGEIKYSPICGNHIVAKRYRYIEAGEIILEEFPLVQSPSVYFEPEMVTDNPSTCHFICLNCFRLVSELEKCSECQWPICNNGTCDKGGTHHSGECKILSANGISPNGGKTLDYAGIELLRYLLLRDTDSVKWAKIQAFEPHTEDRRKLDFPNKLTALLIKFVRRCSLLDYSDEEIDHAIGVISIDTFWSFNSENSRYASLLFHRGSLFAHDCFPNTKREILVRSVQDETGASRDEMFLRVTAVRNISPGDSITINYVNCNRNYSERQKDLKELFYFNCNCRRCQRETN